MKKHQLALAVAFIFASTTFAMEDDERSFDWEQREIELQQLEMYLNYFDNAVTPPLPDEEGEKVLVLPLIMETEECLRKQAKKELGAEFAKNILVECACIECTDPHRDPQDSRLSRWMLKTAPYPSYPAGH